MVTGGPHPSPSGSAEIRSAIEEVILDDIIAEYGLLCLLRVGISLGGEVSVEAERRSLGCWMCCSGKFVKIEQKFSIGGVRCGGAKEGRRRGTLELGPLSYS